MANIQQVRYAAQPAPGFMDYAAEFLTSYMGAKEAKKEQANKELMTLLPALAAQGQIGPVQPGQQGFDYGGQKLSISPWADKTNAPLPGYENIPGITGYDKLNQYLIAQERMNWAQGKPNYQQSIRMADEEVDNDLEWWDKPFDVKLKEKRRRANLYWQGQATPKLFEQPKETSTAAAPSETAATTKGRKSYKSLWE
jgi:hypothetical protein